MSPAVLKSRRDVGGGLALVELEPARAAAAAYVVAGQYVKVVADAGQGYFALAGEPGAPMWTLLVRNAGDASATLATAPIGTMVQASEPLGGGFPLARARGRLLVIASPGSALAVARPLMHARLASGDGPNTHLYLGARAAPELPLVDEIASWVRAARVTLCLSRAELHHDEELLPGAARAPGYVQAAIRAALRDAVVPADALVFAAGPAAMLAELKALPPPLEVVTNA